MHTNECFCVTLSIYTFDFIIYILYHIISLSFAMAFVIALYWPNKNLTFFAFICELNLYRHTWSFVATVVLLCFCCGILYSNSTVIIINMQQFVTLQVLHPVMAKLTLGLGLSLHAC